MKLQPSQLENGAKVKGVILYIRDRYNIYIRCAERSLRQ